MDIVLVANSPGELSALVKPAAETFSREGSHRVILALTPCQFNSGKEIDYANTIRGISAVITSDQYKKWVLRGQKPEIDFAKKGVVLFLGGDLAHAVLIARKLKFPAYAYVQDFIGWRGFFRKFFVPDQQTYDKFRRAGKKLEIVGNLMVDSVAEIPKWNPQKNVITFLPGSRGWQINHMTPIYKNIMREIRKQLPDAVFQVVSSPFEKAQEIEGARTIAFEQVYNSALSITIPGTNTARLAALGIPTLMLFPLDNLKVIPLEGLPHYLSMIPYFGQKFKKFLADALNKKVKYFALPNIKANRDIVPEFRGIIDPARVAGEAVALLNNRDQRIAMSAELIRSMGDPGASRKIYAAL